jgi:hypothetical protein
VERAAAISTLIGTAKLNGVDPAVYLRFLLERNADHPIHRIQELLPWNFAGAERVKARPAAQVLALPLAESGGIGKTGRLER